MADPQPTTETDPRMNEIYMQDAEYEKLRTALKEADTVFRKAKDEIYNYPKAMHPLALTSKNLIPVFEALYPKDSAYAAVGTEFNQAFSGLAAIYNDVVNSSKDVTATADKWFEHLKSTNELIVLRDKHKKEYDHYFRKVMKMRQDRQAKNSKNPKNIETPKEVEWYIRNDRKYDTARSNYILTSMQSYNSGKECLKLRYEYMNPVMLIFSKNLVKFFKGASNSMTGLNNIGEEIARGQEIVKQKAAEDKIRELREAEEKFKKEREEQEKRARDKLEAERLAQEKLRKEREEKEQELATQFGHMYSEEAQQPIRRPVRPRPPQPQYYDESDPNAYEQDYYEPAPRPYAPRRPPPPQQYATYQADPYSGNSSESTDSYASVPAPRYRNSAPMPKQYPAEPYYSEAPPEKDYYQPAPRPRPRGPMRPIYSPTVAPEPRQQLGYASSGAEDWGILQPKPAAPISKPPPSYGAPRPEPVDPFGDMFTAQPVQAAPMPGPKKPPNPFATGGMQPSMSEPYARPAPRPNPPRTQNNNQFDFLDM